jgi:hypothetical protein
MGGFWAFDAEKNLRAESPSQVPSETRSQCLSLPVVVVEDDPSGPAVGPMRNGRWIEGQTATLTTLPRPASSLSIRDIQPHPVAVEAPRGLEVGCHEHHVDRVLGEHVISSPPIVSTRIGLV